MAYIEELVKETVHGLHWGIGYRNNAWLTQEIAQRNNAWLTWGDWLQKQFMGNIGDCLKKQFTANMGDQLQKQCIDYMGVGYRTSHCSQGKTKGYRNNQ